jgi:hypothetical protein
VGSGQLAPLLPHGLGRRGSPGRLRLATGLAAGAAAALLAAVIWRAAPDPGSGGSTGEIVRVGVVEGQSVPRYLDSSRGELAALLHAPPPPEQTWALVSLSAYEPPEMLAAVLGGVSVAQVYLRAPIGAAPTPVVRIGAFRLPEDVLAGMLTAAASRDRERADYARLGRELTGTGPADLRLRRAYAEAAEVAGAEAGAYRERCSCVFAAVVRGVPAELNRIAGQRQVRVVDPAPEVRALEQTEFRAPLPEEVGTVPVETRPPGLGAPSRGLVVAPETSAPLTSSLGAAVTSASAGASAEGSAVGSGKSVPAARDRTAVASAPAAGPVSRRPVVRTGASRGPSGR